MKNIISSFGALTATLTALASSPEIELTFRRIHAAGPDPVHVKVRVTKAGAPDRAAKLRLDIPKGKVTPVKNHRDGNYTFIVTPDSTGVYPITVSTPTATVSRKALVLNDVLKGAGQPMAVEGDVNTEGYEDGITISPDGEYLFIQYAPLYFSGIAYHGQICSGPDWSMFDIANCGTKDNSNWVFDTIGPYKAPTRPGFPTGAISDGKLTHLNLVIPGVANKIPIFPTVFYGFKRQPDGSFRQPFKVAFNDARGTNGPFGLSFVKGPNNTLNFAVAWSNYFNNLGGDGSQDIYYGSLIPGRSKNLGNVTYNEDGFFKAIQPKIAPVSFSSHAGVQGNPHLYADDAGLVRSIWTDDEQVTHNLAVHVLTSGVYPKGKWQTLNLPSRINTKADESQPFFTGKRLYLNRNTTVVYHEYLGGPFERNTSWGPQVIVLRSGELGLEKIFGVGEPTLATVNGKTVLYFVFVKGRSLGVGGTLYDFDLDAAFVELP